jgi:hypothetical protein
LAGSIGSPNGWVVSPSLLLHHAATFGLNFIYCGSGCRPDEIRGVWGEKSMAGGVHKTRAKIHHNDQKYKSHSWSSISNKKRYLAFWKPKRRP